MAPGGGFVIEAAEDYDANGLGIAGEEPNTVETAIALLVEERSHMAHRPAPDFGQALTFGLNEAAVRLTKRIPASAGLGGGSSDGVSTLLALSDFWRLCLDQPALSRLALAMGSDCPFFLNGGLQWMQGRGEILEALPSPEPSWFCLLIPPVRRVAKTKYLFSLLGEDHFSSGARSQELAEHLRDRSDATIRPEHLFNAFDEVADRAFGDLSCFRGALHVAGARSVHLCGSGPALYGLFDDSASAFRAERILTGEGYLAFAVQAAFGPTQALLQ